MSRCGSGSDSIGTVSNTDPAPEAIDLTPGVVQAVDVVEARKAAIGDGAEVRRLLPQRTLRTIGAWCFLDHYGPDEVSRGPGMQVRPHPHIGLQTVSWLFQGLVLHRDSLGSRQLIRPGELNLMTAGRGIAHSEESAADRPPVLHGLQLWIALPEAERHGEPRFAHHTDLPVVRDGAASVTVAIGEYRGERSPAEVFSPLAGYEVAVPGGTTSCCRSGRISSTGWSRWTAPPWSGARSSPPGCSRTCRPGSPRSGCHRPAGAGWPGFS